METYREIETCPKCKRTLEHFDLKGKTAYPIEVFGCRTCNIEVSRAISIKIKEALCPYCRRWYGLEEGHCCCGKKE